MPKLLKDGALNTFEGVASISDYKGNLLFYTDGQKVWNSKHEIMPNGDGLMGDSSAGWVHQPAIPDRVRLRL